MTPAATSTHESHQPAVWWLDGYAWLVASQVLLLLVSIWLLQQLFERWSSQPVLDVQVSGVMEQVDPTAIRRQLLAYAGERHLELPLESIKAQLEQDPWIDHVALYRRWPQSLEVVVHENRPIARWDDGGLVNERGQLFVPPSVDDYQTLPLLQGPAARADEMMREYRNFTQLLRPLGLRLSALTMEERGAWTLSLDNGIELRVGRGKTLERMARFGQIYRAQLADYADKIKQIDVRYTNGLTVTWNEPPRRIAGELL